jgi:hypothetical protein
LEEEDKMAEKKENAAGSGTPVKGFVTEAPTVAQRGAKKPQVAIVKLDMSDEDVVKLDKAGKILRFSTEPGEFKNLSLDVVQTLSHQNMSTYLLTEKLHEQEMKQKEVLETDAWKSHIVVGEDSGQAGRRLKPFETKAGYETYWSAPDKIEERRALGWEVVQGHEARTLHGDGSSHQITRNGQTELVLLHMPKELHEQRVKMKQKNVDERRKGLREESKAKVDEAMGKNGKGYY